MRIWDRIIEIEELNNYAKGSMVEHIGLEFIEITDNSMIARIPIDRHTKQPYGILHGGASATLAETLASMAAQYVIPVDKKVVGIELNVNHLRQATEGWLTGIVTAIRIGRRVQVWDIRMSGDDGKEVSVARLTTMVL